MSWSIGFIGTPENVVTALKAHSEKIDGKSKEEYDAALPHICGLVEQNKSSAYQQVLHVTGNGHGSGDDFNTCSVSIQPLAGSVC